MAGISHWVAYCIALVKKTSSFPNVGLLRFSPKLAKGEIASIFDALASNMDRQTPETAEGSRAHIPYNIM